jgi:hypothetical protein
MEKGGIKNSIQQRNKKQGTSSNLGETMSFSKRGKGVDFDLTRKINTHFHGNHPYCFLNQKIGDNPLLLLVHSFLLCLFLH